MIASCISTIYLNVNYAELYNMMK